MPVVAMVLSVVVVRRRIIMLSWIRGQDGGGACYMYMYTECASCCREYRDKTAEVHRMLREFINLAIVQ